MDEIALGSWWEFGEAEVGKPGLAWLGQCDIWTGLMVVFPRMAEGQAPRSWGQCWTAGGRFYLGDEGVGRLHGAGHGALLQGREGGLAAHG